MNALFACVLLVSVVAAANETLKCYECDGVGCGDTYQKPTAHLKECPLGTTSCRKGKFLTEVERGCAVACSPGKLGSIARADCCTEDGCNGSTAVIASTAFVLASSIAALLFK